MRAIRAALEQPCGAEEDWEPVTTPDLPITAEDEALATMAIGALRHYARMAPDPSKAIEALEALGEDL